MSETSSEQPETVPRGLGCTAVVRTRWCSRGDTIRTVKPMGNGNHIHVTCPTPESCAQANELIASGRWMVSHCVRCDEAVEECRCEEGANAKVSRVAAGGLAMTENLDPQLGCTAVVMPLVPMALGELFGPVTCEHAECSSEAWIIWMTDEEYREAKAQTERHPVNHVFSNKVGSARCNAHSPVEA